MGIEAFIWKYDNGENSTFALDRILDTFAPYTLEFDEDAGLLSVQFGDEANSCHVYLGKSARKTCSVDGLMISRPVHATQLWECVLSIMRTGNVILFFSDETTPLFTTPGALSHFPVDLLDSLGTPRLVNSSEEILAAHSG